jgi:Zn-dependent peptidase ImmA (M78 family)
MENGRRKLTVEQVLEVRLCYMVGDQEWSKLAKRFGVSREAIKNAAKGATYRDLPMPPKEKRWT